MQKLDGKSQTNVVANYKLDRFTLLSSTDSNASIFTNKISGTAASGIYKKAIFLPLSSSSERKFNSGTNIVGKQPRNIKWEVNFVTHKQNYNPNRCFSEGLGCILSENINRRSMDFSRVKVTHQSANTSTALSYLMKMGWTGSREMTAMAKEIRGFTLSQKIIVTAEYLPGKLNMRADWASRNFPDSSKWLLSPKVFQIISRNWGTAEIDLFASRACHQLHTYMAWRPDPHSQALDALQQKWKNLGRLYAHPLPLFSLIGRVLLRVTEEGLTKILVTTNCPAQP